ncbi:hypothetical protein AAFF39_00255 [Lactococcus garvieae]
MNLAQIQSVQYLFNKVYRDSSKKLIVKFDDEHITADFLNVIKIMILFFLMQKMKIVSKSFVLNLKTYIVISYKALMPIKLAQIL